MAPLFPRRRKAADDEGTDEDPYAPVDLDDEAHRWWTEREPEELWRPKGREGPRGPEPERDVLSEHLGEDWQAAFAFDQPHRPPPGYPDPDIDGVDAAPVEVTPRDPYEVLEIEPTASWEEIVAAHRRLARLHHPDRLGAGHDEERQASEERIRDINAAYAELRIRRGR